MSKPVVALQLYTVRDFAEKDLPSTLSQIKAMGYDAVELAGTYGLETAAFKKHLDDAGLEAVSAHVGFTDLGFDEKIDMHKTLGCRLISIPALPKEFLPDGISFDTTKAALPKIAAKLRALGMNLAYHNHAYEFETMLDGTFVLDALFDAIPSDVLLAQIDAGWVTAAGQDPARYIQKYAGRCPSVHLKDIVKMGDQFEDRPVGQGMLDMPAVIKSAIQAGASILVVELDEAVGMTSLEAARQSREYLLTLGY